MPSVIEGIGDYLIGVVARSVAWVMVCFARSLRICETATPSKLGVECFPLTRTVQLSCSSFVSGQLMVSGERKRKQMEALLCATGR